MYVLNMDVVKSLASDFCTVLYKYRKKHQNPDYTESFSLYIPTISTNSGNKCVKLPVSLKEAGSVQRKPSPSLWYTHFLLTILSGMHTVLLRKHTQHALFPFQMLTLL